MCGIAGIFSYDSLAARVDGQELARTREAMVARGPDGFGQWISTDRRVGLAHRRLAIIDLGDTGAQPMSSADGCLHITFNGEIYNYRELRGGLERKGFRFRSTSDTEVLLHLFADRGEAMLEVLRGMFAFAIWDERRNGLFLARDPFGIKPLYYADDGNTLRFASQVKALIAGGRVDSSPDPAGQAGFYLWGHVPEPFTMHRGVRALPAGAAMWVGGDGRRKLTQGMSIPDIYERAEMAGAKRERRVDREELRRLLLDSVRHHLIADVPVGVFLSAGLDSTTLAALAAELEGHLYTVTLGFREFQGTENDETILAEAVARQLGTDHKTIWVSRQDFESEYTRLLAAMDQPSVDGVNSYFIAKAATEAGLKVALSGLGGDELFGGYSSFGEIPRLVAATSPLSRFPWVGRGFRHIAAPLLKRFASPKYAGLLEYGGSYEGAYLLRRGMYMPWELTGLMDPDAVRAGWEALQPILRLGETVEKIQNPHLKVSALETCWYMRNQLLRDADWASMAHSLEVRVPLVDLTLLNALAPSLACPGWPTKRDMAATASTPAPDAVLRRAKTGFSIPVRDWLVRHDPSRRERGLRGWAGQVAGHWNA